MLFLSAYLRTLRPEVPRVVLCGTPAATRYTFCQRLKWTMAIGAAFVFDEQRRPVNPGCANMSDFVEVRQEAAGGAGPQAWTRWAFFPQRSGPPERIPMLHWQGACKPQGRRFYAQHYVRTGLLPQLEPEREAAEPAAEPAAAGEATGQAAGQAAESTATLQPAAAAAAGSQPPAAAQAAGKAAQAAATAQPAASAAQPVAAQAAAEGQPAAPQATRVQPTEPQPAATQPAATQVQPAAHAQPAGRQPAMPGSAA